MENTIDDYRVKVTVWIDMIVCKILIFYSYSYNLQFNMGQDILEGFKAEIYSTGFVKVFFFFYLYKMCYFSGQTIPGRWMSGCA